MSHLQPAQQFFFSFFLFTLIILTFFPYIIAFNGKHESSHNFHNLQQILVGKRTK